MGDSVSKQVSKCKEGVMRTEQHTENNPPEKRIQRKRKNQKKKSQPRPPPLKKSQPRPPPLKKSKPRPPPLKKITVVEEPVNEPVNEYLTDSKDLRANLDEGDYSMMKEFLDYLESSDSDSSELEYPDETFHIKDSTAYEWVHSVNPDK